jgi:hypothetical protein
MPLIIPLTAAPDLVWLSDLAYAPRRVAIQTDPGVWDWLGDLAGDPTEDRHVAKMRKIYQRMRDKDRTLLQLTHYREPGVAILFARVREGVNAALAYADARDAVDASQGGSRDAQTRAREQRERNERALIQRMSRP